MREGIHRLTGTYCPHCQNPISEVIATGHQYCSNATINCDYSVTPGGPQPFSAELFNELQAIAEEKKEADKRFYARRMEAIFRHRKNSAK
ncbi:MAG: hypothetical protein K2W88_15090 [Pararheinheimera sp.]|nr:hypothetical protein [Rheinheimera sp.]